MTLAVFRASVEFRSPKLLNPTPHTLNPINPNFLSPPSVRPAEDFSFGVQSWNRMQDPSASCPNPPPPKKKLLSTLKTLNLKLAPKNPNPKSLQDPEPENPDTRNPALTRTAFTRSLVICERVGSVRANEAYL